MIDNYNLINDGLSRKDLLQAIKITDYNIKNIQNIKQETIEFYNNHSDFEDFVKKLSQLIKNKS